MRRLGHKAFRVRDGKIESFDPHPSHEVAEIVGPIIRKVYGDCGEIGHYEIAIESFRLGRTWANQAK